MSCFLRENSMAYLVHSNSVDIIDSEEIKICKNLPIGVYTIAFSKFKGIFFQKYDYNTDHEKNLWRLH